MVHPKVAEFYNNSGLEYNLTSEDRVHAYWDAVTVPETRKSTITQLHRHKSGTNEYLWYYLSSTGEDEYGNSVPKFERCGRYSQPHGQYEYNQLSRSKTCTGILDYEEVYEIPWSPDIIDKLISEGKRINDHTTYYADSISRSYTVDNLDDFKNLSHEDLTFMGRTGLRPTEKNAEVAKEKGKAK